MSNDSAVATVSDGARAGGGKNGRAGENRTECAPNSSEDVGRARWQGAERRGQAGVEVEHGSRGSRIRAGDAHARCRTESGGASGTALCRQEQADDTVTA